MKKIIKNSNKGITLIALVITIIVLMILAGISIGTLTGEMGLIKNTNNAKEQTEIENEKEILNISVIEAIRKNKYGNLEKNVFEEILNINGNANIIDEDENDFIVKFTNSERYYQINKDGDIEYIEGANERTLTVKCINSKNEVLEEKKYIVLQDKYSKTLPQIEGYVCDDEKIEGMVTEDDTTITVMYYLYCKDEKTLVFTGLDINGNVTTDEGEIVSYMVGNGGSEDSNALIDKEIYSIVEIPEEYNGLPVTNINRKAFKGANIFKVTIPKSIKILSDEAFVGCINLKFAEVGGGSFSYYVFSGCSNLQKVILGDEVALSLKAFSGCISLEEIVLEGKIAIKNSCNLFEECNNLTIITLVEENENYKFIDDVLYSFDKSEIICVLPKKQGEFVIPETVSVIGNGAINNTRYYKISNSI